MGHYCFQNLILGVVSILFKIHYPFPILVAIFTMTVIMISLGRDTKSSIDIAIPF